MHKFSKLSPFVQTLYEDNTSDEAGVSECIVCTVHVCVYDESLFRVLINPDLSGRISSEVWANERMQLMLPT